MEHGMDVQPYVWVSLKQKYLSSLAMLTKSFEGNVILNSDFTIQKRGDMYPLKMTLSGKFGDGFFSTLIQ